MPSNVLSPRSRPSNASGQQAVDTHMDSTINSPRTASAVLPVLDPHKPPHPPLIIYTPEPTFGRSHSSASFSSLTPTSTTTRNHPIIPLLLWLICSCLLILLTKLAFTRYSFPYPTTLSLLQILPVTLVSHTPLISSSRPKPIALLTHTLPSSLLLAAAIQQGNTAYLHLPISLVQALKPLAPVLTLAFAFALTRSPPRPRTAFAAALTSIGLAISCWADPSTPRPGLFAMLISTTCEAARYLLHRYIISSSGSNPGPRTALIEQMRVLGPWCCAWLAAWAWLTEGARGGSALWAVEPAPLLSVAVVAAGVHLSACWLAREAEGGPPEGARAWGMVRSMLLVGLGMSVLGERLTALRVVGYSAVLVGDWMLAPRGPAVSGAGMVAAVSQEKLNGAEV